MSDEDVAGAWLFDVSQPIIIDDHRWREKQAFVLGLPRFAHEPKDNVRRVLTALREMKRGQQMTWTEGDVADVREHIQKDLVAFIWHLALYRDRDRPKRVVATPSPGQLVLLWRIQRLIDLGMPVRIDLLKQRQGGFSWLFANIIAWIVLFHPLIAAVCAAQDILTSKTIFQYVQSAYRLLPPPLRPTAEHDSKMELSLRKKGDDGDMGLESSVSVQTAGKDFLGTGQPIQVLHASEIGKWHKVCDTDTTYTSVVNAIQDEPFTFVFRESTAFGADTFWHKEWERSKRMGLPGWNGHTPVFIPWYFDPRNARNGSLVEADYGTTRHAEFGNERRIADRFKLDVRQMAWRRSKVQAQTGNRLGQQAQEHPDDDAEAWRYAGGKWFDVDKLDEMRARLLGEMERGLFKILWMGNINPRRILGPDAGFRPTYDHGDSDTLTRTPNGALRVFRWPDPTQDYIISGDPTEGVSDESDAACIKVYQRRGYAADGWAPLRLCAEFHGIVPDYVVADIMWRLGHAYHTGKDRVPALLVWERTGAGRNISRYLRWTDTGELRDDAYPPFRMYQSVDVNEQRRRPDARHGLSTSKASKLMMLSEWRAQAEVGHIQVTSDDIREVGALSPDDRGNVDTNGRDRFMAMVFAAHASSTVMAMHNEDDSYNAPQVHVPGTTEWHLAMIKNKRDNESRDVEELG